MSALCLEGHTFFPFILSVFKLASFPKLINAFKYLLLLRKGRKESREEGREEEGKEKDSRQTRKKTQRKKKKKSEILQVCFFVLAAPSGILVRNQEAPCTPRPGSAVLTAGPPSKSQLYFLI